MVGTDGQIVIWRNPTGGCDAIKTDALRSADLRQYLFLQDRVELPGTAKAMARQRARKRFRHLPAGKQRKIDRQINHALRHPEAGRVGHDRFAGAASGESKGTQRSEEHTSEL